MVPPAALAAGSSGSTMTASGTESPASESLIKAGGGVAPVAGASMTPSRGELGLRQGAGSLRALGVLTPPFSKARRQGYHSLEAGLTVDTGEDLHDGFLDDDDADTSALKSQGVPGGAGGAAIADGPPPTGALPPAAVLRAVELPSSPMTLSRLGSAPSVAASSLPPSRRTSVSVLLEEANEVIALPPLEKQHAPFWSPPRREAAVPAAAGCWPRMRERFRPDDELLKRRLSKRNVRLVLMGVFSMIMVRPAPPPPPPAGAATGLRCRHPCG